MLEIEIQQLEDELKRLCQPSYVKTQNLSGMPHGTHISDPTAQIAIDTIEGRIPHEAQLLSLRIDQKRTEWQDKRLQLLYIDVWLDMLTEAERWVIQMHCIERYSWQTLVLKSPDVFGDQRSKDTLRRIYRAALAK